MSNTNIKYLTDKDAMCRRYSKEPILPETKKYVQEKSADKEISESLRWSSYYKDGATKEEHLKKEHMRVLARDIPKMNCLKCGEKEQVRIIFVQGNIHPMCGDAYYDVEN